MLDIRDIQRLFDDHDVYRADPDAEGEHLTVVVYEIGVQRSEVHQRPSRLDDGFFASWAICIPMFPKNDRYRQLMRSRRREYFFGRTEDEARVRAHYFFTSPFLRLELDSLARLVSSPEAMSEIEPYLGRLPRGFS
jgi:hypothetical protein